MQLCRPDSTDVFENLALEDSLLDRGDDFAPLLLLYVNAPCMVIGKNQVPWRECATGLLRARGVPLARRTSGGGAVWHDEGNLNYSFILPRETYKQDDIFAVILAALESLGIEAQTGPHNGLYAGGRKFSGTAFCYRRQHVLHHGTLLVNSDLEKLRAFCAPALPQIATKAIASRPASVVNLSELRPGLTTEELGDAIAAQFPGATAASPGGEISQTRAAELRSWDFVWGHTPRFEFSISDIRFAIEHGVIVSAPFPPLIGARFDPATLRRANFPMLGNEADALFQALEVLA